MTATLRKGAGGPVPFADAEPVPSGWPRLLSRLRWRLRAVWAAAFLQWVAPVVAVVALAVIAIGWVARVPSPDWAVAVAVLVGLLGVLAVALLRTIPTTVVARAADRWLATDDAFITAHERMHEPVPSPLDAFVERRAERWATGVRPGDVVPVRTQPRRLLVAAGAGVAALIVALVPGPQDDARARAAVHRAALTVQAETLRTAAADLRRESGSPVANLQVARVAQKLDDLAGALQRTSSLESARAALDRADAALAKAMDPNALAAKTAVRGLERSLQGRPLRSASTAGTAAAQLRASAGDLDALTPGERAALADRLEQLARAQQAGNREAADALKRAADSLRAGDKATAARALNAAAKAQERATQRAAASDAASRAAEQVAQARQGVQDAADGAAVASPANAGSADRSNSTADGRAASAGANSDANSDAAADASGVQVVSPNDPAAGTPGGIPLPKGATTPNPLVQGEGSKSSESAGQVRAADPASGAGQSGDAATAQAQAQAQGQAAKSAGQGQAGSAGQGKNNGAGNGQGNLGDVPGLGRGQGQGPPAGQALNQGQGAGQGLAQGRVVSSGSSAAGKVAGASDTGQTHKGVGGSGTPNGSGNQPTDNGVVTGAGAHIYDPTQVERLTVNAPGNEGPSQGIGKADGPTRAGGIAVPLAQALPKYAAQAAAAAHSTTLTPSERGLVRAYFERLAGAAGGTPTTSGTATP